MIGFDIESLSPVQLAEFITYGRKREAFLERIEPMISAKCSDMKPKGVESIMSTFQKAAEAEVHAMIKAIGAIASDGAEVNVLHGDAKAVFDLPFKMIQMLEKERRAAIAREAELEAAKTQREEVKAEGAQAAREKQEAEAEETEKKRAVREQNEKDKAFADKVKTISTVVNDWPDILRPCVSVKDLMKAYTGNWEMMETKTQDYAMESFAALKAAVKKLEALPATAAQKNFESKKNEFFDSLVPLAELLGVPCEVATLMQALHRRAEEMMVKTIQEVVTKKAGQIGRTNATMIQRQELIEANAVFLEGAKCLLKEIEVEKERLAAEAEAKKAAAAEAKKAAAAAAAKAKKAANEAKKGMSSHSEVNSSDDELSDDENVGAAQSSDEEKPAAKKAAESSEDDSSEDEMVLAIQQKRKDENADESSENDSSEDEKPAAKKAVAKKAAAKKAAAKKAAESSEDDSSEDEMVLAIEKKRKGEKAAKKAAPKKQKKAAAKQAKKSEESSSESSSESSDEE